MTQESDEYSFAIRHMRSSPGVCEDYGVGSLDSPVLERSYSSGSANPNAKHYQEPYSNLPGRWSHRRENYRSYKKNISNGDSVNTNDEPKSYFNYNSQSYMNAKLSSIERSNSSLSMTVLRSPPGLTEMIVPRHASDPYRFRMRGGNGGKGDYQSPPPGLQITNQARCISDSYYRYESPPYNNINSPYSSESGSAAHLKINPTHSFLTDSSFGERYFPPLVQKYSFMTDSSFGQDTSNANSDNEEPINIRIARPLSSVYELYHSDNDPSVLRSKYGGTRKSLDLTVLLITFF